MWLFDGSSWSAGPKVSAGPKERIRMDFDPQLGGDVIFGGMGPGRSTNLFWLFKGGAWLQIKKVGSNTTWPASILDAATLWNPAESALMVFAGIAQSGGGGGPKPLSDVWFYYQPDNSNLFSTGGTPGSITQIRGQGFNPSETVDIHFDSKTGILIGNVKADANGGFPNTDFTLGSPLAGGDHKIYGVGRTSGIVGTGILTVSPKSSIDPSRVHMSDTTVWSGLGFVPGQTVTVSFPGGTAATGVAGANGSVTVNVVSPAEPQPGGTITGTSPGGATSNGYTALSQFTSPSDGVPQDSVPISGSGYGADESVKISFDADPAALTLTANAKGSFSGSLLLDIPFGSHTITAKGASSGETHTNTIKLPPTMTLSPASGPAGTTVTVDSGPGWVSLEVVHVWWGGNIRKDVNADSNGKVHTTYQVPSNANKGDTTFRLTDDVPGRSAEATFKVT
jgi:hypothetical protein